MKSQDELPFGGNLWEFMHDMADGPLAIARRCGELARFELGGRSVVLVSRPEWVERILVTQARSFIKSWHFERIRRLLGNGVLTSDGELHRQQRRKMMQAFHSSHMERYSQTMVERAVAVRDQWQPGTEVDVDREMHRLTLSIVGRTLFDTDVADEQAAAVRDAVVEALEIFPWMAEPLGRWFDRLPVGPAQRFLKARARLDGVLKKIISSRQKESTTLLSLLLSARDESGKSGMSDAQLRDELMTIFTAGHETTANALSWTWLLLSQNPETEARFHQELDQVLEKKRLPILSDVDAFPYTRSLVAESMRLYPPVFLIARQNVEPFEIGGYRIKPGTGFFVSPYVSHRDGRFFPDPDCFDPTRFTPENVEKRPKFSYYPFGGGHRGCLGERFAWSETVLLLAVLGQRYSLRLRPGFQVRHRASVVLCPANGLPMSLIPR